MNMESYRRSRMVDSATSTDSKVTPVYKLDEVAEVLRTSDVSIVREVSELIFKRLDHKDPVVKHKVLRLIKYAAGKSSAEFQSEMRRNSAALRQLLHYKGHPDPLKGDALNKAVRDSAQEAMAAIFSGHDTIISTTPPENHNRRIEGFGNTNFNNEEKKSSFLTGMLGFGTASIKQGLNSLARGRSFIQHGNPNSKGRNLWRSLTVEIDYPDKYVQVESPKSNAGFVFNPPRNGSTGFREEMNEESESIFREDRKWVEHDEPELIESKSREEKLVETIVTLGGVRLQPTRDNVRVFLTEAAKLDGIALSRVLESKIHSSQWQVRMRAVCVLESIIRKKSEEEDESFSIVADYFGHKKDALVSCLGFPQASLQEKAKRVLRLLDDESTKPMNVPKDSSQIPNLIDTGDAYSFLGREVSPKIEQIDRKKPDPFVDLLGDGIILNIESHELKNNVDPFADVSFNTEEPETTVFQFVPPGRENPKLDVFNNLMAGLSINQKSNPEKYPIHNGDLSSLLGSQEIANNCTFGNGVVPNYDTMTMFDTRFVSPTVNYMSKSCNQQQEETQAFDFIADHLTAVRDLKKVT